MEQTISVSQGRVALQHDSREHHPNNADRQISGQNIYIKTCNNLREEFNGIFRKSVEKYNSKQKRADRHIKDYYDEIKNSKRKEQVCYEYTFQIGNKFSNPTTVDQSGKPYWNPIFREGKDGKMHRVGFERTTGNRYWGNAAKISKEILEEYAREFEQENPQFKVVSSVIHMDEQTPHLHIAFIPVATGYKQKMDTRCSLTKSLEQMGYNNSDRNYLAITQWKHRQEEIIEEKMRKRNITRAYGDGRKTRYDIQTFKGITEQAEYEASRKINAAQQKCEELVSEAKEKNNLLHQINEKLKKENAGMVTEGLEIIANAREAADKKKKEIISQAEREAKEKANIEAKNIIKNAEYKSVEIIEKSEKEADTKAESIINNAQAEADRIINSAEPIITYKEVEKIVEVPKEVEVKVEKEVNYKNMAIACLNAFSRLIEWIEARYNCIDNIYSELGENMDFLRTWKTLYPRSRARVEPLHPDGEAPATEHNRSR